MKWTCFAATGPGHFAVIESTVSSSVYQSILGADVRPRAPQLKLAQDWVMRQGND